MKVNPKIVRLIPLAAARGGIEFTGSETYWKSGNRPRSRKKNYSANTVSGINLALSSRPRLTVAAIKAVAGDAIDTTDEELKALISAAIFADGSALERLGTAYFQEGM